MYYQSQYKTSYWKNYRGITCNTDPSAPIFLSQYIVWWLRCGFNLNKNYWSYRAKTLNVDGMTGSQTCWKLVYPLKTTFIPNLDSTNNSRDFTLLFIYSVHIQNEQAHRKRFLSAYTNSEGSGLWCSLTQYRELNSVSSQCAHGKSSIAG